MKTINIVPSKNLDEVFIAVEETLLLIEDSNLPSLQKEILYEIFKVAGYWYPQVANALGNTKFEYIDIYVDGIYVPLSHFLENFNISIITPSISSYAIKVAQNCPIEMGNVYDLNLDVRFKLLAASYNCLDGLMVRFPIMLFNPLKLKEILDRLTSYQSNQDKHNRTSDSHQKRLIIKEKV